MHRTTGRFMQVWIFSAVRSSDGVVRFEKKCPDIERGRPASHICQLPPKATAGHHGLSSIAKDRTVTAKGAAETAPGAIAILEMVTRIDTDYLNSWLSGKLKNIEAPVAIGPCFSCPKIFRPFRYLRVNSLDGSSVRLSPASFTKEMSWCSVSCVWPLY